MTFPYYDPFGTYTALLAILIVIILVSCILQIVIAVWIYNDAKKRNMEATMWLAVALLAGCIGCIIYLIVRDPVPSVNIPETKETPVKAYDRVNVDTISKNRIYCSNCGSVIPKGANFCPSCGNPI